MRKTKAALWAVMLTVLVVTQRVEGQAQISKLDPALQLRVGLLTGTSKVVITAPSPAAMAALSLVIQQVGGTPGPLLEIINGQAATVPNPGLAALANSSSVSHVAVDRIILGSNERAAITSGATAVRQALGVTGDGIGVAVIDSGIAAWHSDFSDPPGIPTRIDRFVDFVAQLGTPYDDHGHGTHVAGIIAGNGSLSSGKRKGIAPLAHITALKVLDGAGHGNISKVIAALNYAVQHRTELNLRVVNMSIATSVSESYMTDPLAQATKAVTDLGIVVVAAAGNAGRNSQGYMQYGGVTAPGNAPWVLTVGSYSHEGTHTRADDIIALSSSRGPTAVNRAAKPDLVAPGVGIESLSAPGSTLYSTRAQYLLNGTIPGSYIPYLSLSGTSQATPVVAGTVALMLEANPALTPNAVKAILQYTAEAYPGYDPLTQGAGFLNAKGAVELAHYFASPTTRSYPSTTGWSQSLVWGNHRIQGGRLSVNANAWLTNVVWGSAKTPGGENVAWGEICTAECQGTPVWEAWQTTCGNSQCTDVTWGAGTSFNVVWGTSCNGADCSSQTWYASDDAVVWGTAGDDAVVWGTSEDAVVWGTSDDAVVWGTECNDDSCEPVVWEGQ
jgi:serine protease AprX